jgi:hypothetical protein
LASISREEAREQFNRRRTAAMNKWKNSDPKVGKDRRRCNPLERVQYDGINKKKERILIAKEGGNNQKEKSSGENKNFKLNRC